jgi:hypothetical protein
VNPEAQRIAIAEACGWTDCEHIKRLGLCKGKHKEVRVQYDSGHSALPDYLNDLNAMHEAEKILNHVKAAEYARMLTFIAWQSEQPVFAPMTATAAQRAEAFLRTLNLWKP